MRSAKGTFWMGAELKGEGVCVFVYMYVCVGGGRGVRRSKWVDEWTKGN